MQADFFRHESPVADSPYPEGCTSRLGRAQRVRFGGVARRRAVQQRRAKVGAILATQIRSSLPRTERGARADGCLSRLSPAD